MFLIIVGKHYETDSTLECQQLMDEKEISGKQSMLKPSKSLNSIF